MAEIVKPDLCIIGAGALGTALAVKARQRGLATILVNRSEPEAGDPAQGALHRAAFAASAARAHALRTAGQLGLDNGAPKVNFKAITEHAAALAAAAAPRDSDERLIALGVVVLSGEPEFVDRQTLRIGQTTIKPGHTILATGAAPMVPEMPGLREVPFFTSDTILDNMRKLSHLLVIGGDANAVELAQIYRRLGSDVTLVPQGQALSGYDSEMVAILLRQLREEGVAILDGATVTAIVPRKQGTGVSLRHADGREGTLDISHVLIATGRVPQLDAGLLDKARVKRDGTKLEVAVDGKTSNARISAFGGAAGEDNHQRAMLMGERLLDRLAGKGGPAIDGRHVPHLVATEPALAQVGLIETVEGVKPGQIVLRTALAETDAARALGSPHGSAKLIVDKQGKILGGAMVGIGAGEAMATLALAMQQGLSATALAQLPLTGTSALAAMTELAGQFGQNIPASAWAKRRAALRQILP